MRIKEFAYHAQTQLDALTTAAFKRSHIYELTAAAFGFRSYAALGSDAIFVPWPVALSSDAMTAVTNRGVDLGFTRTVAEVAAGFLVPQFSEAQIGVLRLDSLVESFYDYLDQLDGDSDQGSIALSVLEEELTAAAAKDQRLAHYSLALLYEADDDEREVGRGYWFEQEAAGAALSGVQKEWADEYSEELASAELHEHHLREAARLGFEPAMLDLAEAFGDHAYFESARDTSMVDPMRVAEIAEGLGRTDDARRWLTLAAESGDVDAMRSLIDDHLQQNLPECWKWMHLSRLLGADLSMSAHCATNEDGSDYDDDVGGPAYVTGEDGIELVPLDAVGDAAARAAADSLFRRIQAGKIAH